MLENENININKLKIRKATLNDIKEIAKLHIDSWNKIYKGIISDKYLESMKNNLDGRIERMKNDFNLREIVVGILNDEIVVFAEFIDSNKFSKEIDIDCELCGLYVKNEYLGLGIGSKVFAYVKNVFIKENKKKMGLWCLKENTNAIKFYKAKGGKEIVEKEFVLDN